MNAGPERQRHARVAYYSMEIGLDPSIPTYSGGLGILAGDTLRAAADFGLEMAAVTLVHREGYFFQRIAPDGSQLEERARWEPQEHLVLEDAATTVELEGRSVTVRAWRYDVRGVRGHVVPVYLLDTDVAANREADRAITRRLYGGDAAARLRQEAVLGIGGVRMLQALGYERIARHHMNEGHAALLVLELVRERAAAHGSGPTEPAVLEGVRRGCVFTTHTPVAAGHDRFPLEMVRRTLEPVLLAPIDEPAIARSFCVDGTLHMTLLGFAFSRFVNAVAKRHGEVSRALFPDHRIESITNGVHAATWTCPAMAQLFDRRLPGWREDALSLRAARRIPLEEIVAAHRHAKSALVELLNWRTNAGFDEKAFTIGFARRATAYKRAELLLSDPDRLRRIAREAGRIQLVFAGKAHPNDAGGKEIVRRLASTLPTLSPEIAAVYLPNYDMAVAQVLIPGVDLWLNTPLPPLEASGTSGMKAALNGVPTLSTLDGWWLEGHFEGVTGWAVGADRWRSEQAVDQTAQADPARDLADARHLHDALESSILPLFLRHHDRWAEVMRNAIAVNGSYFNTHRMVQEYATRAYADTSPVARPARRGAEGPVVRQRA